MGRGIVILGVQRGDCFVVSIIKELIRGSLDLIETSSRIVVGGRSCSTRFGNSSVSRILSTRREWKVETSATIHLPCLFRVTKFLKRDEKVY